MDHSHDQPLSPEEDAALAQTLLAKGELCHGAFHLTGALVSDPRNPEWLELLDRFIDAADEPLALAPLKGDAEGNYFGTVAVRAYILAKMGHLAEGVALLLQVVAVKPEVPFLDWAIEWLNRQPSIGAQVDRKAVLSFFGEMLQRHPGTVIADSQQREQLEKLLRFAEQIIGDPDPETILTYTRAALARKVGRFDEALALAERGYRASPCYHLASAIAEVCKARDDEDGFLKWQQIAVGHDAQNVPTRLDLGDYYFNGDRYEEAARWYQEALDIEPGHPWATPSLYAARLRQGQPEWQGKLQAYMAAHPDNERAAFLVRQGEPYLGYLPAPQEATLGILRQITELAASPDGPPKGEVRVTLSALEAPSARLACNLGLDALGLDLTIPFTITAIQQPDPRLPRQPVRHQVWKYREETKLLLMKRLSTDPVACVPEPPPEVARAVAELAMRPFDRPIWFAVAGDLVRRIRPRIQDLLGIMAHPPELPTGAPAPIWLQRIQVVAALAIANLDPETAWPQSQRKQILFDLVNGPMDWTVDAAIIALTALAQSEPGIVPELTSLFLELLHNQPRPGYVCYQCALVCCFQQLPGLPTELSRSLAEYRLQMEKDA